LTDANRDESSKFESEGFEGAFVFPTQPGYYNAGIASFDFNSLYPNIMMTLNMSPETMIGKVLNRDVEDNEDDVFIRKPNGATVKITKAKLDQILKEKCCISANNVLFVKPAIKFGIIPTFLDGLYSSRVQIKKEMKNNKKEVQRLEEEIKQLEEELAKIE